MKNKDFLDGEFNFFKIIDNVDLKELEKFGFHKDNNGDYEYIYHEGQYYDDSQIEICVLQEDRNVYSYSTGYTRWWSSATANLDPLIDKIYELTKANLLEKVVR